MSDRQVVALQIGREPRSVVDVATRCHLGLPVVTKVPPHLDDGTPFPTTYWLSCPLATRRIGRLEADGGVRRADVRIAEDAAFAAAHAAAMQRYRHDRDALIEPGRPGPRPSGGVGGARDGVKCLHAHYADFAAGNQNPVGEETAAAVEPLDCSQPCVVEVDGAVRLNPDWMEP
jgi:hypothetical protein